jgi:integrase
MPKKRQSWTVEAHGVSVLLYRRGDSIHAELHRASGERVRRSLKTGDKATANQLAKEVCRQEAESRINPVASPGTLKLSQLFRLYNDEQARLLNEPRQKWIRSRQAMFAQAWGEGFQVLNLAQSHIERYSQQRRAGTLTPFKPAEDAKGRVKGRKPVKVSDGTLSGDFRWLSAAFNWACGFKVNGKRLLPENPLHGLKLPREINPKRPVASHDRYVRTQEHTDAMDPRGRLRAILALARYTGRRIDAITELRVSDVLLSAERLRDVLASTGRDERLAGAWAQAGAIRWRPENDKQGFDELAPLNEGARNALEAYLRASGRVGDAVLFPAPLDDSKAIDVRLITRWLLKAEAAAKLPKLERGCFHPYRRLWATERTDMPDVNVAKAGGWRSVAALRQSYQQADGDTMLRVVNAT